MPLTPQQFGDQLIGIGNNQKVTAVKMKAASAQIKNFGNALADNRQIVQTIAAMSTGLDAIRNLLGPVNTALTFISNTLGAITIPTVNFTFTNVVGIQVINGITIGSRTPFTSTATKFATMATSVTELRQSLRTMVTSLNSLRTSMPTIQRNILDGASELNSAGDLINATGEAMIQTGTALRS